MDMMDLWDSPSLTTLTNSHYNIQEALLCGKDNYESLDLARLNDENTEKIMELTSEKYSPVLNNDSSTNNILNLDKNDGLQSEIKNITIYRLPGELLGIGLHIIPPCNGEKNMHVFVKTITPGGPASRPHEGLILLQEGDEILEINDVNVGTTARNDCVEMFRSAPVCVKLKIIRKEDYQSFDSTDPNKMSHANNKDDAEKAEDSSEVNNNKNNGSSIETANEKSEVKLINKSPVAYESFNNKTINGKIHAERKTEMIYELGNAEPVVMKTKTVKPSFKENILSRFSDRNLITRNDGSFIVLATNGEEELKQTKITHTPIEIIDQNKTINQTGKPEIPVIKKSTNVKISLENLFKQKLESKNLSSFINNSKNLENSGLDNTVEKVVTSSGDICKPVDLPDQVSLVENTIIAKGDERTLSRVELEQEFNEKNEKGKSQSNVEYKIETLKRTFIQTDTLMSEKMHTKALDSLVPRGDADTLEDLHNTEAVQKQDFNSEQVVDGLNKKTIGNQELLNKKIINGLESNVNMTSTISSFKSSEFNPTDYELVKAQPALPAQLVSKLGFTPNFNSDEVSLEISQMIPANQIEGSIISPNFTESNLLTQANENIIIHSEKYGPTQGHEVLTKALHMPSIDIVTQALKCSTSQIIMDYDQKTEQNNQHKLLSSQLGVNCSSPVIKLECSKGDEAPSQVNLTSEAWNQKIQFERANASSEGWSKETKPPLSGIGTDANMDTKVGYKSLSLPASRRNSFGESHGLKATNLRKYPEQKKQNLLTFSNLPLSRMEDGPFLVEVLNTFMDLGLKTEINTFQGKCQAVISGFKTSSPLARDGNIRIGDILLAINGRELIGLERLQILQVLRTVPRGIARIVVSTPLAAEKFYKDATDTQPLSSSQGLKVGEYQRSLSTKQYENYNQAASEISDKPSSISPISKHLAQQIQSSPRVPSCERLPPDGHEYTGKTYESLITKYGSSSAVNENSFKNIKVPPPVPTKQIRIKSGDSTSCLVLSPPPLPLIPPPLRRDSGLPDLLFDSKPLSNQNKRTSESPDRFLKQNNIFSSVPIQNQIIEFPRNNNYPQKQRRRTIEGIIYDANSNSDKSSSVSDKTDLVIAPEILHTLSVKEKIALFSKEKTNMSTKSEKGYNLRPSVFKDDIVKATPANVISVGPTQKENKASKVNSFDNDWDRQSNSGSDILEKREQLQGEVSPVSENSGHNTVFYSAKLSEPNLKLHNARLNNYTRNRSSSSDDILNDINEYRQRKGSSFSLPRNSTNHYSNRWTDSDTESCISMSSSQDLLSCNSRRNHSLSILDSLSQRRTINSKLKGLTIPSKSLGESQMPKVIAPLIVPSKDISIMAKTVGKSDLRNACTPIVTVNSPTGTNSPFELKNYPKFKSAENISVLAPDVTSHSSQSTISSQYPDFVSKEKKIEKKITNVFYAQPFNTCLLDELNSDEVFHKEKPNIESSYLEPLPIKHIRSISQPTSSIYNSNMPTNTTHTPTQVSRQNAKTQSPCTFNDKLKKFSELENQAALDQRRTVFSQKVANLCKPQDSSTFEFKPLLSPKEQVTDDVRAASKVPSATGWSTSFFPVDNHTSSPRSKSFSLEKPNPKSKFLEPSSSIEISSHKEFQKETECAGRNFSPKSNSFEAIQNLENDPPYNFEPTSPTEKGVKMNDHVIKELKTLQQFAKPNSLSSKAPPSQAYKQHQYKTKILSDASANRHQYLHSSPYPNRQTNSIKESLQPTSIMTNEPKRLVKNERSWSKFPNDQNCHPKTENHLAFQNNFDLHTAIPLRPITKIVSTSATSLSSSDLDQLVEEANQYLGNCNLKETKIFAVVIKKEQNQDIGLSLRKGFEFEASDIVVEKIVPGSLADQNGQIEKGDHIILINGKSVNTMSLRQITEILKTCYPEINLVLCKEKCTETAPIPAKDSNFVEAESNHPKEIFSSKMLNGPSRKGFGLNGDKETTREDPPLIVKKVFTDSSFVEREPNHLKDTIRPAPEMLNEPSELTLDGNKKVPLEDQSSTDSSFVKCEPNSPKGIFTLELENGKSGLGFSIDGGKNSTLGDRPLLVKKIFAGGVADHDGRLAVGDELLMVQNKDMTPLSRFDAWTCLRTLPPGPVILKLCRSNTS